MTSREVARAYLHQRHFTWNQPHVDSEHPEVKQIGTCYRLASLSTQKPQQIPDYFRVFIVAANCSVEGDTVRIMAE